jgi:O-methyltransferase
MQMCAPIEKKKYPQDMDQETIDLFESVEPFTMTSILRVAALRHAVRYIAQSDIPGDIVECGVWKGGSMMAIAKTLLESGSPQRTLRLFDTFEGMSEPTDIDRDRTGAKAAQYLEAGPRETNVDWSYAPLDEVRHNMQGTGYDPRRIVYIKGKIEDTLPRHAPDQIALLRLDTDWYQSTYHELVHLYPRLSVGGVLIIDDYGHWQGARRAVDQYIEEHGLKLLLNRVDYTARICVKTHP